MFCTPRRECASVESMGYLADKFRRMQAASFEISGGGCECLTRQKIEPSQKLCFLINL